MIRPITAVTLLATAALAACSPEMPTEQGTVVLAVRAATVDEHGGRPFATSMSTETFVDPNVAGGRYTGDPDGSGTARLTINVGQQEVCWELTVSNIAPLPASAAHIHAAAADASGPIVVGLTPPGTNGSSAGCRSDVDPELLRQILLEPENYYVNVHTLQHPRGAVRGQLAR